MSSSILHKIHISIFDFLKDHKQGKHILLDFSWIILNEDLKLLFTLVYVNQMKLLRKSDEAFRLDVCK